MTDPVFCQTDVDCPCYARLTEELTRLRGENERLRVALASIDKLFSQAAQDDCEHGVKWLNERAAKRYLAAYPHTSAAISYAHKVARAALGGDDGLR